MGDARLDPRCIACHAIPCHAIPDPPHLNPAAFAGHLLSSLLGELARVHPLRRLSLIWAQPNAEYTLDIALHAEALGRACAAHGATLESLETDLFRGARSTADLAPLRHLTRLEALRLLGFPLEWAPEGVGVGAQHAAGPAPDPRQAAHVAQHGAVRGGGSAGAQGGGSGSGSGSAGNCWLPASLTRLTSLKVSDASWSLAHLPPGLGALSLLQELVLSVRCW